MKSDRHNLPHLALTLGDPSGIGPEVILKALADPAVTQNCQVTVVGSQSKLQETYTQLLKKLQKNHSSSQLELLADPAQLSLLDVQLDPESSLLKEVKAVGTREPRPAVLKDVACGSPAGFIVRPEATSGSCGGSAFIRRAGAATGVPLSQINTGIGNAASGAASFAYLETAIARAQAGEFQGIVTGPIAKSAWKAAGYNYPGQTELLAERSGVERFGMLFVALSPHTGFTLRTLLATTHIPLRQVADTLTPELLATKLDLLVECLRQDFGLATPRIAIAGLNPHSGEQGQLGQEEQKWLIPWLEQERRARPELQLDGPVPPDTMWVKPAQAWYGWPSQVQAHDAYLALYHDQGLIPVKQLAFDRAVNTSIGLPFIRTSPDHGTAFDIAGQGIADATSMKAALSLAARLAHQRLAASV